MRAGGEQRGNSRDRARRRAWLLENFDKDLGPERARCWLDLSPSCAVEVDRYTLTVDRIHPGESYRRGNIQPACAACQNLQGALITQARRVEWQTYVEQARAEGVEWDGHLAGAY